MTPEPAFCFHRSHIRSGSGPSAAGPAGHCRRGAHQYRPGAVALRRAVAAGQPGHRGRHGHCLCPGGRSSDRHNRRRRPLSSPRRQAVELARRRPAVLSAALALHPRRPSSGCSLNSWPWPWPRSFPGAREPTACASPPAAPIAAVLAAIVFPLLAHWIWAGGWLGATGRQLLPRLGISRSRRRGHCPRARRLERAGRGLDRRTAQGQVPPGRLCHRHARPQRRLHPLRLPAGAGRLAGLQRRRRCSLAARAARRPAGHRDQHAALGFGRSRGHLRRHPHPLRQARRQPLRQRLARRPGGFQRLRGPRLARCRRCSSAWSPASSRRCWSRCWSWPSPSTTPRAPSPCTPPAACGD